MLLYMCLCVFVSNCIAELNEGNKDLRNQIRFGVVQSLVHSALIFPPDITSVGMFVSLISCLVM